MENVHKLNNSEDLDCLPVEYWTAKRPHVTSSKNEKSHLFLIWWIVMSVHSTTPGQYLLGTSLHAVEGLPQRGSSSASCARTLCIILYRQAWPAALWPPQVYNLNNKEQLAAQRVRKFFACWPDHRLPWRPPRRKTYLDGISTDESTELLRVQISLRFLRTLWVTQTVIRRRSRLGFQQGPAWWGSTGANLKPFRASPNWSLLSGEDVTRGSVPGTAIDMLHWSSSASPVVIQHL